MGKYDKYFITEKPRGGGLHDQYMPNLSYSVEAIAIDGEANGKVPGAYHLSPHIIVRPSPERSKHNRPHNHDFDEYLLFMSFDPENPVDLPGEVEFWMDGECHVFTKTTAIFIPRFVWHLPMVIRRVDKPFGFIAIGNTLKYAHFHYHPDPKYAKDLLLDDIADVTIGDKKFQVTRTYSEYLEWLMERTLKK